ncbi:MAG: alpha/beta fold hydrolase [Deltaproteobacteria bacterium]|nr:alpha/beta fold hydrolase [Deltaproteobacteria bacterium]
MQTTLNWRPHSRIFKDHFRVVTYDARAQGKSDLGEQSLTLDLHVQDLSELLHHLKIKKAHLVGLSHGAYVALAFASRLPDFVGRLVLCSISVEKSAQTIIIIKSWLGILKSEGLDALAWTVLPVVFGEIFLKQNKRIIDKMVVSGSQDQLVNPKEARHLADLCRGLHEEIPDIGHSVPAEAPELFNKIVLKFLLQL